MAYRILIADDESTCRSALAALLGDSGFQVEQAEDGSTALERLLQDRFDLSLFTCLPSPESRSSLK